MTFRALLVLTALIAQCRADAGTTCEANDPRVAVGENTTITCNFGRDVSRSKHNIVVQLYQPSSLEPVSVLKCNWLVKNPHEPTCTIHSGCSFTSVNDTLRINIRNATKELEGKYRCQLVPSEGIHANACSLTVTDGDSFREDQGIRRNGTVTSNNDSKLPEERRRQPNVPAIVLGILLIILVVVNIVILYLWRRERQILKSSSRSSTNRESALSKCTPMLGVDKTLIVVETL